MSEEQPRKDKLIAISLRDGDKGIELGAAIAEYFHEFYTDPVKRADATASLIVAQRNEISQEAMMELFWAGIYFAKKHPEKVVIEEKEPETERPRGPGYWT